MAKDPAFLFYPNDYLGGTMGMTFEEKGAYMELLMMQFNRGHMTTHMIGQTVGQLWDKLSEKFIQDDKGLWYNVRLEQEQIKRKSFTDSRKNNIAGTNQYTKKSGHKTKHMTGHMENVIVNGIDIIDNGSKVVTWRDDFNIYLQEASAEFSKAVSDKNFLLQQKDFYPNLHLTKTIQKSWTNYWGTEKGWKKKKSSKTVIIDWRDTITNALSLSMNKVYLTKQEQLDLT